MQTNQPVGNQQKSLSKNTTIIIGVVGVLLVCCICILFSLLVYKTPSPSAVPSAFPTAIPIETMIAGTFSAAQTQYAPLAPQQNPTQAPIDTPLPPTAIPPTEVSPTAVPASPLGSVGDRVESGGIALTIMNVYKVDSINDFLTPEPGNTYLVIEAVLENTTRTDETPYNPLYFKVKDSNGFEYTTSLLAPDPSLHSGSLPLGDKVRGLVAFEVKIDAVGFTVIYEPLVMFGGYEPIRINLGQ